jgi:hypothetical protein
MIKSEGAVIRVSQLNWRELLPASGSSGRETGRGLPSSSRSSRHRPSCHMGEAGTPMMSSPVVPAASDKIILCSASIGY